MFVLIMLFLFKYIDDLIGKGFEWYVILELLGHAATTNIPMALPLSMLLSSIMTFGNLGESYELVAIKAAGYSLRKAMTPLIILVCMVAGGSFLFSEYTLPVANLKMWSLMWDVRNKKADFLIKPGVFNKSIPGYSIRAKGKNEDGTILYDLMIYDHRNGSAANNVLIAKEGYIHNSADNNYMILRLKDGVRYEESRAKNASRYDPRQQFTRFRFDETEQKFDMSAFQMTRTDENAFRNHYAMLNLRQLKHYADSNKIQMDSVQRYNYMDIKNYINYFSSYYHQGEKRPIEVKKFNNFLTDFIAKDNQRNVITNALGLVQQVSSTFDMKETEFQAYHDKDVRYRLEFHRKFTLAVSCLLLFALGAPLGAIIRKGGLGLPVVVAIIFFLIYHIISTMAEKSAKDGGLDPVLGMWMAIIVLSPLAIFLTYKAATDSALFDVEQYKLKLQRFWKLISSRFTKKAVQ
ncbi:lipopolysaccharide export system permease protein [Sphingobacterium wenxiniae]|uniref:Lipopolysaccharide export system permease protein n=2 Tax=Sphingobacterium wenxiniae TaxID=683125 RepID=A0A1I6VYA4_9SPHI|nr:lipopolysaccharide export system permease protein [Sphingobacterium wenxiniae]